VRGVFTSPWTDQVVCDLLTPDFKKWWFYHTFNIGRDFTVYKLPIGLKDEGGDISSSRKLPVLIRA